MKKMICLLLALVTCLSLMTACSFFSKEDSTTESEKTTLSDDKESTGEEDNTDEENTDSTTSTEEITTTEEEEVSTSETKTENPRDNVANDSDTSFTATGKYCGFIDSNSVEIELSDGSCCSFFAFEEDVRTVLTSLNEEDMPEITFTYKAREGQINPEMIAVTPK